METKSERRLVYTGCPASILKTLTTEAIACVTSAGIVALFISGKVEAINVGGGD